jgi:hypothetical protein
VLYTFCFWISKKMLLTLFKEKACPLRTFC